MFARLLNGFGKKSAAIPPDSTSAVQARVYPIDVNDVDFASKVLASGQLSIVDFWAEWCESCRIMSAYVGILANDYAGRICVAALDVDENPETPARYEVMGLPTLLLLREGQEVDRIVGVTSYDEIRRRVDRLLGARV